MIFLIVAGWRIVPLHMCHVVMLKKLQVGCDYFFFSSATPDAAATPDATPEATITPLNLSSARANKPS